MIEARNIPSQMLDASPDGLMKDVPEQFQESFPSIHLNPLYATVLYIGSRKWIQVSFNANQQPE